MRLAADLCSHLPTASSRCENSPSRSTRGHTVASRRGFGSGHPPSEWRPSLRAPPHSRLALSFALTVDSMDALAMTNTGDTDAVWVTVVLHLSRERETHAIGNVPAKTTVNIPSARLTAWMVKAREHEVVHPGFRVHWSSPLGQVSDETRPLRDVGDFIDWEKQQLR